MVRGGREGWMDRGRGREGGREGGREEEEKEWTEINGVGVRRKRLLEGTNGREGGMHRYSPFIHLSSNTPIPRN